jgi:hypothetical protein
MRGANARPANYIQLPAELINTRRLVPGGMRHDPTCAIAAFQTDRKLIEYLANELLFKADL